MRSIHEIFNKDKLKEAKKKLEDKGDDYIDKILMLMKDEEIWRNEAKLNREELESCVNWFVIFRDEILKSKNYKQYTEVLDLYEPEWFFLHGEKADPLFRKCDLYLAKSHFTGITSQDFLVNWPEFSGLIIFWDYKNSRAQLIILQSRESVFDENFVNEYSRKTYNSCEECSQDFFNGDVTDFWVFHRYGRISITQNLSEGGLCLLTGLNFLLNIIGCPKITYSQCAKYYKSYFEKIEELESLHRLAEDVKTFKVVDSYEIKASNLSEIFKTNPELKNKTFMIGGQHLNENTNIPGKYSSDGHVMIYNGDTGLIKEMNFFSTGGKEMETLLPSKNKISKLNYKSFGGGVKGMFDYAKTWILSGLFGNRIVNLRHDTYVLFFFECVKPNKRVKEIMEGYKGTDNNISKRMLNKKRKMGYVDSYDDYIKTRKEINIEKIPKIRRLSTKKSNIVNDEDKGDYYINKEDFDDLYYSSQE